MRLKAEGFVGREKTLVSRNQKEIEPEKQIQELARGPDYYVVFYKSSERSILKRRIVMTNATEKMNKEP